jgi:hypothetical protein
MNAISPNIPSQRVRSTLQSEVSANGVLVNFEGGPWSGQVKRYRANPRTIGCVIDAHARGMHGVYKTPRETWSQQSLTSLTAVWLEVPRIRTKVPRASR